MTSSYATIIVDYNELGEDLVRNGFYQGLGHRQIYLLLTGISNNLLKH